MFYDNTISYMMPQFGPKMKNLYRTKIGNDLLVLFNDKKQFDECTLESIGLIFRKMVEHLPELLQSFFFALLDEIMKMINKYNIAPILYDIQLCMEKANQSSTVQLFPTIYSHLNKILMNSNNSELICLLSISCIISITITSKTLNFDHQSIEIQLICTLGSKTLSTLYGEILEACCVNTHKLKWKDLD